MAFVNNNTDQSPTNKQRLNLSSTAYQILRNDMFTFGEEHWSTFINKIFTNYFEEAQASIERALSVMNGKLAKLLKEISDDDNTKKRILKILEVAKKDQLREKAQSYGSGRSEIFTLNKDNLDYLTGSASECKENQHYTNRGKYIKSVIEEYTQLPYIERERVYYKKTHDIINEAISRECQLKVNTNGDNVYSVYPYKILHDPMSTANYLVGYSKKYDSVEECDLQPCSFRISAIDNIKIEKSKSAFLKKELRKNLSEMIENRGVQYLIGKDIKIRVRLTNDGIKKYRRLIYLRPMYDCINGNVFTFSCTKAQAEFYFFKFGKDAEILEPLDLREKFAQMYKDAALQYQEHPLNDPCISKFESSKSTG